MSDEVSKDGAASEAGKEGWEDREDSDRLGKFDLAKFKLTVEEQARADELARMRAAQANRSTWKQSGPAEADSIELAALPAPGDTSTPERIDVHTPDLSGANLTVKQTVKAYAVSERTVMAKLKAGTVPGAQKVPGPNGEQWLIPTAAAAQLWKPRTDAPGVDAAAKPEQPDQSQLLREIIEKQLELHAEMRSEIAALRSQIADLEQITHRALTAAPTDEATSMPAPNRRPRWWKRKQ